MIKSGNFYKKVFSIVTNETVDENEVSLEELKCHREIKINTLLKFFIFEQWHIDTWSWWWNYDDEMMMIKE